MSTSTDPSHPWKWAAADDLYREGIDRLTPTQLHPELARLLYGEWLRRTGRRASSLRPALSRSGGASLPSMWALTRSV